MLNKESVKRVIDTFAKHDESKNEKYEKFKSKDNPWSSDRDRFIGRFFNKYIGKYFILMDKEIIAYQDSIHITSHDVNGCSFYSNCEPLSIYSRNYRERSYNHGTFPVFMNSKKFLHVTSIHAVNPIHTCGFIEMTCHDILGRQFRYVLDYNNLINMQFREITVEEFERMVELFRDDRDDRTYKVTRYLSADEMKSLKKSKRNGMVKETITVMAKDSDDAYMKCTNVSNVEAC